MRIVTELMDRVFSDSTPQEFKDLVMDGIEKAFSEGSYELKGEGYNLSFAEVDGSVAIEDKLNGNEVTIAKPEGNEVKLEGSATQPNVVVPKVKGETKPVEAPDSTQPDVNVSIEPAITDADKAGKDKHFSVVFSGFESEDEAQEFYSNIEDLASMEDTSLTFSEDELENVSYSATEAHELYERLQGTGDADMAFSLKEKADVLKAYSVLAQQEGYDMDDLIYQCNVYSDYADDVLDQIFSDMDINEYFSNLDEEEVQLYFSGLDEVESDVLYSALLDEDNYTFSEVEDIVNEVYSEIELSQPVQEVFSELTEDELNEYFSQFTDQEAQLVYSSMLDEDVTFSDLNDQLNLLYTPLNEIFSDMTEEEILAFSDELSDDEIYIFSELLDNDVDDTATFSDLLDAFDYVNSFSDTDASTLVENTEELEKAAKAVTESPEDTELAKKVKVLADKTSEDAEIARESGYDDLANEVQAKCAEYSEVASEALDKAGVDPNSIDAGKVLEEVKEAKAIAEHADDKAGAAVQKAAEAKGDAEGAKANAVVAAKAAGAGADETEEQQKTHSRYSHVLGTENRSFSKGVTNKNTGSQVDQKLFSDGVETTKSRYSTLKSAIN